MPLLPASKDTWWSAGGQCNLNASWVWSMIRGFYPKKMNLHSHWLWFLPENWQMDKHHLKTVGHSYPSIISQVLGLKLVPNLGTSLLCCRWDSHIRLRVEALCPVTVGALYAKFGRSVTAWRGSGYNCISPIIVPRNLMPPWLPGWVVLESFMHMLRTTQILCMVNAPKVCAHCRLTLSINQLGENRLSCGDANHWSLL